MSRQQSQATAPTVFIVLSLLTVYTNACKTNNWGQPLHHTVWWMQNSVAGLASHGISKSRSASHKLYVWL